MMHPANTWTVEFAAREHQAREECAPVREGRDGETCRFGEANELITPRLRSVGHLLLVVGSWVKRPAGDGASEPPRKRQVQPGIPS